MIGVILLISVAWLVVGFISFLICVAIDYRGQSYDRYTFRGFGDMAVALTLGGPISIIVLFCMVVSGCLNSERFGRFVYKMINVGKKE